MLLLQTVPYKGSLPTAVPTDPLIYRFYELVNVYGTTFKELIHEEFGDGIMSAIDFEMDITRQPDPKGDRVKIVMSGKFLPYKQEPSSARSRYRKGGFGFAGRRHVLERVAVVGLPRGGESRGTTG